MRKLLGVLSCVLMGAMLSCAQDVDLNNRPLFSTGSNSLTFLVYDGVTGAPVTNATLTLSVGAYTLTPSKVTNNAYVIAQVPYIAVSGGGLILDAQAQGYVSFTGLPTTDCQGTVTGPSTQCFKTYTLALYPNRAVAQDVTVKAFNSSDGSAVTNGSVVATLVGNTSLFGTLNFTNPVPGTLSSHPNTIVASLDASGSVILPKDQLVFGGTYNVNVFGVTDSAGRYLTPVINQTTLIAGRDFPQLTLFVGPPAVTPVALSANNEKATTVNSSLVVQFPYPIQVCSEPAAQQWTLTAGSDANADGIRAAPAAQPNQVTATATGGTLTVTPNFAPGPGQFEAADGLQEVTFSGIKVGVVGSSPSSCQALNSVLLRSATLGGTPVSQTIRIAGPLS